MSVDAPGVASVAGRQVGNYDLLEPLGSGATAEVHRARHRVLLTEHAIKVLTLRGKGMQRRVLQEGRIQARIRHPNVVAVTDVLELDGRIALVAEYVPGPTLSVWLAQGTHSRAERLDVFRQIVAGVGSAHDVGVVHRDLKPDNVIMDVSDDRHRPRVTDFGLARLERMEMLGGPEARGPRTREGAVLGTPAFMAPEQFSNAAGVDARADIFALGCILYMLLFDAAPFPLVDMMAAAVAIHGGRYVRPFAREPGLDPRLAEAVERCLEPNADGRPQTCAALLAILDGPIPSAPKPPSGDTGAAPVLPVPFEAQGASGMALTLTGEALDTPPMGGAETLVPEADELERRGPPVWVFAVAAVLGLGGLGMLFLGSQGPVPDAAPMVDVPTVAVPSPTEPEPPVAAEPVVVDAAAEPVPPVVVAASKRQPTAWSRQQPTPAPAPVEPAPEPAEPPPAKVEPRPAKVQPAPPSSAFRGTGGAVVALHQGGNKWPQGPVDPGVYAIYASFGGAAPVHAGDVTVKDGETVLIACVEEFQQCRRAR